MTKHRPVNLELSTISLPIMGVASILHRISAVVIWLSLVFFLPCLYISLKSPEGHFKVFSLIADSQVAQFFVWGFLSAYGYYACGTIKHIIQECGYCEELNSGRAISWIALSLGIVLSIGFGIWIWA